MPKLFISYIVFGKSGMLQDFINIKNWIFYLDNDKVTEDILYEAKKEIALHDAIDIYDINVISIFKLDE
jgi:hypothetical protein